MSALYNGNLLGLIPPCSGVCVCLCVCAHVSVCVCVCVCVCGI